MSAAKEVFDKHGKESGEASSSTLNSTKVIQDFLKAHGIPNTILLNALTRITLIKELMDYFISSQGNINDRRVCLLLPQINKLPLAFILEYTASNLESSRKLYSSMAIEKAFSENMLRNLEFREQLSNLYKTLEITFIGSEVPSELVQAIKFAYSDKHCSVTVLPTDTFVVSHHNIVRLAQCLLSLLKFKTADCKKLFSEILQNYGSSKEKNEQEIFKAMQAILEYKKNTLEFELILNFLEKKHDPSVLLQWLNSSFATEILKVKTAREEILKDKVQEENLRILRVKVEFLNLIRVIQESENTVSKNIMDEIFIILKYVNILEMNKVRYKIPGEDLSSLELILEIHEQARIFIYRQEWSTIGKMIHEFPIEFMQEFLSEKENPKALLAWLKAISAMLLAEDRAFVAEIKKTIREKSRHWMPYLWHKTKKVFHFCLRQTLAYAGLELLPWATKPAVNPLMNYFTNTRFAVREIYVDYILQAAGFGLGFYLGGIWGIPRSIMLGFLAHRFMVLQNARQLDDNKAIVHKPYLSHTNCMQLIQLSCALCEALYLREYLPLMGLVGGMGGSNLLTQLAQRNGLGSHNTMTQDQLYMFTMTQDQLHMLRLLNILGHELGNLLTTSSAIWIDRILRHREFVDWLNIHLSSYLEDYELEGKLSNFNMRWEGSSLSTEKQLKIELQANLTLYYTACQVRDVSIGCHEVTRVPQLRLE